MNHKFISFLISEKMQIIHKLKENQEYKIKLDKIDKFELKTNMTINKIKDSIIENKYETRLYLKQISNIKKILLKYKEICKEK